MYLVVPGGSGRFGVVESWAGVTAASASISPKASSHCLRSIASDSLSSGPLRVGEVFAILTNHSLDTSPERKFRQGRLLRRQLPDGVAGRRTVGQSLHGPRQEPAGGRVVG